MSTSTMVTVAAAALIATSAASGCKGGQGSAGSDPAASGSCDEAKLVQAAALDGPAEAIIAHCQGVPKATKQLLQETLVRVSADKRQRAFGKSVDHILVKLWPQWERLCPGLTKHSAELCLYPAGKANKTCQIGTMDGLRSRLKELTGRCALHKHGLFTEAEAGSLRVTHEVLAGVSLFKWMTKTAGVSKAVAQDVLKAMIGAIPAAGCGDPGSAICLKSLQRASRFRDTPVKVSQRASLRLAGSRGSFNPEDSIAVTIGKSGIVVDSRTVVLLRCTSAGGERCKRGAVEAAGNRFDIDRQHFTAAGKTSPTIEPLEDYLEQLVAFGKEKAAETSQRYNPVVTFVVDHQIPYRIIARAFLTAGSVGLTSVRYLVLNPSSLRSPLKAVAVSAVMPSVDKAAPAPLNLTVMVVPPGIQLLAAKPYRQKLAALLGTIPKGVNGEHAFNQLYSRLRKIRALFPNERTLNVGAEMETPWQTVLAAIDAGQVVLDKDSYPSMAAYRKAKRPVGRTTREPAFPSVMFVVVD